VSLPPATPSDAERLRLAQVQACGTEVAGSPGLRSIVALAAQLCDAPIAAVALVDADRVRLLARQGLAASDFSRADSFCDRTIRGRDVMVVGDAAADGRFAGRDPAGLAGVRFYAGAPVLSPDGVALGAVCVMDTAPRAGLDPRQTAALQSLAHLAASELEKHRVVAGAEVAEQRYREIVETTQEGVALIDRSGVIEYANRRLADLLGCDLAEVTGRLFTDFLHADGPTRGILDWFAAPRGPVGTSEVCVRRCDGTPLWVHASASPRFDRDGARAGTLAMITDLTSVRIAEERRRETETSFRYLFEMNPNMMWVFDDETMQFLAVNAAAVARFGYSRDEFLRLTIFDVRPPEEHERLRAQRAGYDRRAEPVNTEAWTFLTRSGERFDGELSSYTIEFGGRPSRITVIRDVTARRKAEAQLRESEASFRHLFDQNPNPMVVCADPSFRVLAVNEAALQLYGYRREAFIGLTPAQMRAPEAAARPRPPAPAYGPGVSFVRLSMHRRKSGEVFPVDARGSAISFGGRPAWLLVVRDVSEQQRAQAMLAETENKLRQSQKLEAIGHLTGGIAHDFNNLLMVILGNIELLQDMLPPGSDGADLLAAIARAAERGADLTSHLLSFARRQALAPHEVEVNVLLGKMHALLARSIGEHIVIRLEPGEDVWPVLIDPTQLETALLNLVVNARDAMPDGGVITLTTANASIGEAAGQVDVAPGDYVLVSVADTGTGMAPDVLSRAFDPFFTTKEPGKGSGLGLSMVYGFVHQSGGQVRLESTPGGGTRATLYLPRAPSGARAAGADDPSAPPPRGGSECILVVEDDRQVREIVELHLRSLGYRVLRAAGGAEALEILRGPTRIDLMLSDVVMPGGINGRQLSEQAARLRPGLRILLVSGYSGDASEPSDTQGPPLLRKPYRRDELATRIREMLDGPA
jgi:PAS domain S-box-containing protein